MVRFRFVYISVFEWQKRSYINDNKRTNYIGCRTSGSLDTNRAEAGLLNKRSCLAAALGVTEFEAMP